MLYARTSAVAHTHTHRGSLKVSAEKPILSLFLCALFPTVRLFSHPPPVAMCHHLPSALGPVLSADRPENNLGAKSVPLVFRRQCSVMLTRCVIFYFLCMLLGDNFLS